MPDPATNPSVPPKEAATTIFMEGQAAADTHVIPGIGANRAVDVLTVVQQVYWRSPYDDPWEKTTRMSFPSQRDSEGLTPSVKSKVLLPGEYLVAEVVAGPTLLEATYAREVPEADRAPLRMGEQIIPHLFPVLLWFGGGATLRVENPGNAACRIKVTQLPNPLE